MSEKSQFTRFFKSLFPLFIREGQVCTVTDSIQFLKTKGVTNNQLQQGQPELASNLLSLFDESSLPEFVKAVTRQRRTLQIFLEWLSAWSIVLYPSVDKLKNVNIKLVEFDISGVCLAARCHPPVQTAVHNCGSWLPLLVLITKATYEAQKVSTRVWYICVRVHQRV